MNALMEMDKIDIAALEKAAKRNDLWRTSNAHIDANFVFQIPVLRGLINLKILGEP